MISKDAASIKRQSESPEVPVFPWKVHEEAATWVALKS
jgi:hypothetical protein